MNHFKFNASNNNTTNGGSPSRTSNAQITRLRNVKYLNLPITINSIDSRRSPLDLSNKLLQSNVQSLDQRQSNQNIQGNLPAPPPTLNPSNFPRFNRALLNSRLINNHTIQNVVFGNTIPSSYDLKNISSNDLFSTKTKPKENGFKISNDDFPALPENNRSYQQNVAPASFNEPEPIQHTCSSESEPKINEFNKAIGSPSRNLKMDPNPEGIQSTSGQFSSASTAKTYMKVSPHGKVTNIPGSMLRDQFGIAGELMSMALASERPDLVELNLGRNLCEMGLNLNSPDNIHPTFAGPFADVPLPPHRHDVNAPEHYYVSRFIKLPSLSSKMLDVDLIFYLFYNFYQEETQLFAANKLFERGWAYHKLHRVWMVPDLSKQALSEDKKILSGDFLVFDYALWRAVKKTMVIAISDLELDNNGK